MKYLLNFVAIFVLLFFLPSCTFGSEPSGEGEKIEKTIPYNDDQLISLEVNTGLITIQGSDDNQIKIEGLIPFPEQTTVQTIETKEQITVLAEYLKAPLLSPSVEPIQLNIRIPDGADLQIEGFDTDIVISEFAGTAVISLVAGNIEAEQLAGSITLRSGRGDIRLTDSAGRLRVLGEHGTLAVVDSKGDVGMSSIMGTIDFKGNINAGENVHLEVDHGPVHVQLEPTSDVSIIANSTSGDVACMVLDRSFSTWGCTAKIGPANGRLDIRTVSGRIDIRTTP